MPEISAKLVKELRDKTGAGMMDCKKALAETSGDLEKAVDYLRTKGLADAKKKSGRATKEGLIYSYIHPGGKVGVLVEIACETDFVARTDEFQQFVHDLARPTWYKNAPGCSEVNIDPQLIMTASDVFRISSEATLGESKMTISAVVRRVKTQKTGRWYCKILSWQEF